MTEKEIEQLEIQKKERWDRYSELTSALEYGRAEGRKEGFEIGFKEGLEEVRRETTFRRLSEIVIRLFKNGYDAESIVSLLDEPLDIVQKILDEHGNEDQVLD